MLGMLKEHLSLRERILEHFSYQDTWMLRPLQDWTDSYWFFNDSDVLVTSSEPFTPEGIEKGGCSSCELISRTTPVRKDGFVLVAVDTNTDGNQFLVVLDESKECHDEELKELRNWCW